MLDNPRKRSLGYIFAKKYYQDQQESIDETNALWEHLMELKTDIKEIKGAIEFMNPNIKFWGETLSKSKEIIVRREHRAYYAILPALACQVNISWGQIQLSPTASLAGWLSVTLPDGAKISLQNANTYDNVPALVCVSNCPIVLPVDTAPLF